MLANARSQKANESASAFCKSAFFNVDSDFSSTAGLFSPLTGPQNEYCSAATCAMICPNPRTSATTPAGLKPSSFSGNWSSDLVRFSFIDVKTVLTESVIAVEGGGAAWGGGAAGC